MTVGSLFSGIGGLDLGFERAGFEVRWMCEQDAYCKKVLAKHWPDVPCFDDVRELYKTVTPEPVDVIIGGFPCQDLSYAGKGAGLDGAKSGLWWEMHRIISAVRPRYAVMENVPGLFTRGIERVLGSLAEIGYDAEWEVVSAASQGAPHIRERVFIVAYTSGLRRGSISGREREPKSKWTKSSGEDVAYTGSERRIQHAEPKLSGWWQSEPNVGRVANGVPARVDRLKSLGNAVVPQVAEYVARRVMAHAKNSP